MQIYDSADVTGDGSRHTLASALGFTTAQTARAKWWQVTVVSNSSGVTTRVGGPNISTSRGIPVLGAQFSPPIAEATDFYDLQKIYYLAGAADTVSVAYAY